MVYVYSRGRRTSRCGCSGSPASREWWISLLKQSTTRLKFAWIASVSGTCHVELDKLPKLKTRTMCNAERPARTFAQTFVQDAGLTGQGGSFGRHFLGKMPPKHAAEPRDCPCRPRALQRVGVMVGVGLIWADVQG